MILPERIVLVGFMGSGKSTVGRRLADRIGYRFADTDTVIESSEKASVSEIFELKGEGAFRELEHRAILGLLGQTEIIIATGGGAFAQPASADAILEGAFAIHLDCSFAVAFDRVAGRGGRPLVEKGRSAVEALFAERKDKYSRAHATVDTSDRSPDDVVSHILLLLAPSSPVH